LKSGLFAIAAPGQISHQKEIAERLHASVRIFTGLATWSNGFFNTIKHCRRAATRYDKLAANYLAVVQLAPGAAR
jgi:transposase